MAEKYAKRLPAESHSCTYRFVSLFHLNAGDDRDGSDFAPSIADSHSSQGAYSFAPHMKHCPLDRDEERRLGVKSDENVARVERDRAVALQQRRCPKC